MHDRQHRSRQAAAPPYCSDKPLWRRMEFHVGQACALEDSTGVQIGYGSRGAGGVIPPNATLVFEVTLLATK